MRMRKVSIDGRNVLRKRRVQINTEVSFWHDEFDCGAQISHINDTMEDVIDELHSLIHGTKAKPDKKPKYGVGKQEGKVSDRYLVDLYRGVVSGNG
jgi:hypothetical protein